MFLSKLRIAFALLLAVIGIVGLSVGPAAAADDDVAWAVRTASNDYGADRQNYSYTLNPGGKLEDALVVVNHGDAPLQLAVYAADGFTTESGQLDLVGKDEKSTGVGAWLHAGVDSVTIKPGKSANVPFAITLPDNATPGDYMGGIITSLSTPDAVERINVDQRLAIRVRLRVGGELKPGLAVEDLHVDYSGTANPVGKGDATISYTVHNTGNAILTARQTASVSGPFGLFDTGAEAIADSPELLPGETWDVTVPVHGVAPAVRLTGKVALTALLKDASGSVNPLPVAETSSHAWTLPWALLLLLVVLVAIVVLAIKLSRRRRREAELREEARVQKAVEEALQGATSP
jgi:hypothetical protein